MKQKRDQRMRLRTWKVKDTCLAEKIIQFMLVRNGLKQYIFVHHL